MEKTTIVIQLVLVKANRPAKKNKIMKYIEQYPKGKPAMVYYDPADPKNAVLKSGITGGAIIILAISFLFVIVGIVCFLTFLKQRRRQSIVVPPT